MRRTRYLFRLPALAVLTLPISIVATARRWAERHLRAGPHDRPAIRQHFAMPLLKI